MTYVFVFYSPVANGSFDVRGVAATIEDAKKAAEDLLPKGMTEYLEWAHVSDCYWSLQCEAKKCWFPLPVIRRFPLLEVSPNGVVRPGD